LEYVTLLGDGIQTFNKQFMKWNLGNDHGQIFGDEAIRRGTMQEVFDDKYGETHLLWLKGFPRKDPLQYQSLQ